MIWRMRAMRVLPASRWVARAGTGDQQGRRRHLVVGDLVPGHPPRVEAEVAQLVDEHRGEPVFGVDDEGIGSGEAGLLVTLGIEPEGGEPRVPGLEECCDAWIAA